MSSLDVFLDKSKLFYVAIKGPGIERSTGEGNRTKSRSQYVTQTCIDPKAINFVNAMRQEELRTSRHYGLRIPELGDALAISDKDSAKAYADHLKAMKIRFDDLVELLCNNWPDLIDAHAKAFPADAESIRSFAPSVNTVRLKAKFSWAAFTLKPDQIDDAQELEASLSGSVPTQAFFEFKNQLIDSFSDYGKPNWAPDCFTQAVRTHLEAIARKAESLVGFHPSLDALPGVINNLLKTTPTSGKITGTPALAIRGLMLILSNPQQAMKYGFTVREPKPPKAPKPSRNPIIEVPSTELVLPPGVASRYSKVTDGSSLSDW